MLKMDASVYIELQNIGIYDMILGSYNKTFFLAYFTLNFRDMFNEKKISTSDSYRLF